MNITQEQIFKELMVTSRSLATNPSFDTADKIITAAETILCRAFKYATQCKDQSSQQPQQAQQTNGEITTSRVKAAIQLAYDSKGEDLLALATIASVFKSEFRVNWENAQELAKKAADKGLIVKKTQYKYMKNF